LRHAEAAVIPRLLTAGRRSPMVIAAAVSWTII
jgi:hypothetical protein